MFADKKNRAQLPFQANGRQVFDLPMGSKITKGCLIVTGTITLANVTAQGVANGEGGPIDLINRIIVHANPFDSRYPGGEIVYATPRSLLRYAALMHSGKFVGEQSGSTLGSGAAGTYNVYLSIPIYWADPTLRNADLATALNTDPGSYASIQVEVDMGDITSCFTGWTATTAPVYNLQLMWVDDRLQMPGDTNVVYQEDHQLLIGAANKRALDPAMPKDGLFTHWLLLSQQSTANTLADTLLNRVTVTGKPVDFDKYAQDIRQSMIDDEWIDPSQPAAGMHFLDWADGIGKNSLEASTVQVQFDVNNPSGTNQDSILFYTRRVFVPAPAPATKTK